MTTTVCVQFSDSTETKIVAVFGCPQDATAYPNQAQIASSDARYLAFTNPQSAQAASALAMGLAIASTGTPGLNGIYACDPVSQMDIISIETSINAGKGFPGGAAMFSYPDLSGAMHSFSQANFTNFAAAIRDYVYALKSFAAGSSSTVPPSSVTIN